MANGIKYFINLILFLYPLLLFGQENTQNQTAEDYFIQKSRNLNLAQKSEWRKLLFYQNKYFTSPRGLVDGKEFYLSEEGRSHSQSELEATIRAFFSGMEGNQSAQCKFPRRLKWLKFYLEDKKNTIPIKKCQNLEDWLKVVDPKGVALIFSSFYMNNPSSMFGHTFLKIQNSNDPLTDSGVNFAANPDTENPIMYMFKGLTGFFEGKFSLLPYSVKVQEYNNSESRDLWEYELNLNKEQSLDLVLSLWEVGDNRIDYYYFDENCSFVLLALLDTVYDDFNFASKFGLWVNPADTLRVVYKFPNLIKNVTFRPSSEKRFRYRYSLLDADERKLFYKAIDYKIELPTLKEQRSPQSVSKILDAILEYIDFKEKLAGTEESKKYPVFRKQLLQTRASLGVVSSSLNILPPEEERPEKGGAGARAGVGFSHSFYAGNAFDLEIQPVLHSLDSPSLGYSKEAQIEMLSASLRYEADSKKFFINKLDFVNIISIPSLNPPLYPMSWNLEVAIEQDSDCSRMGYQASCQRYFIAGGTGASLLIRAFQLFLFPQVDFAYQNENAFEVSLGTFSGIALRPLDTFAITSRLEWMRRYSIPYQSWREHFLSEMSFSFIAFMDLENKIFFDYNIANFDWRLGATIYWHFF